MRDNDLNLSSGNREHNYHLKMTKTRTVTFLIMIISTCGVILSITDAYPTAEVTTESNATAELQKNSNDSMQFAITHVVKTIEFQFGILEDDGNDSNNSTEVTTDEYIETDIKLLNVNLLRELLDRLPDDNVESTSEKPKSVPETEPPK